MSGNEQEAASAASYPAAGLRQLIAMWLRAPLERAYLEGYRQATQDHRPVIREYERALRGNRH